MHRVPDAPEPSDEDLVRLIRGGDEAAAAVLFDRHATTMRAAAQRGLPASVRGKVGPSDVVQDAWLAAFHDLSEFEDREGSFARWLRQVLEHKLLNAVRHHAGAARRDARRDVRIPTQTGAAAGAPTSGDPSPSAEVAAAEELSAVRALVATLAPDDRTVLRLVHEEACSFVDAATRMGRSPDAVRMLYGRALERLADKLGPRERGSR